jgi:hypothetical protein
MIIYPIAQGDVEGVAYIIQRGSCIVQVEKDGKLFPVGHRGEGDIVGMTTILTGEPCIAHVEAETGLFAKPAVAILTDDIRT